MIETIKQLYERKQIVQIFTPQFLLLVLGFKIFLKNDATHTNDQEQLVLNNCATDLEWKTTGWLFPFAWHTIVHRCTIWLWRCSCVFRCSYVLTPNYHYIISSVMHAFWLVLTYDLLEDRRIDDVIIKTFFSNSLLYKTNRFQILFYKCARSLRISWVILVSWAIVDAFWDTSDWWKIKILVAF